MSGIKSIVTSHYTARNSGTSFSEAEFNNMVLDVALDVGNDNVFDQKKREFCECIGSST